MDTRAEIIKVADGLIRAKGFNAFSYSDISRKLKIRNASIHYHFPTKSTLGMAVVADHRNQIEQLKRKVSNKDPLQKLHAFLRIYSAAQSLDQVCLVGSLATDLYTVDTAVQNEMKKLVDDILLWVTGILTEGKTQGMFHFKVSARTKALLVITNMLASLQLTRLTVKQDFQHIKKSVIDDLTLNT